MEVEAAERMEWTVDLSDELKPKRWIVLGLTLLVMSTAIVGLHSPLLALLGAVAVLASSSEVFLPVRYWLDAEGAHRKIGFSESLISWPNVKRMTEGKGGVHLSPFEQPSRLDGFRGVYLRTTSNQEAVLVKIAELRDKYGRELV